MAEASLKLGGDWGVKEGSLLGFNDQNGNYKPIPFDFTRATTATRVNRDGLIEEVQAGVPRIDFTSDGSLLLEPQRTNLVTYSEYLLGFFTTDNVSLTHNYGTSPDGSNNSVLITQTGTSASNSIYNFGLPTTDGSYTYSFFFKAGTSTSCRFYIATGVFENFNPQTITAGYSGGTLNILFEDYGNGWWRASATQTLSSAPFNRFIFYPDRNNSGQNIEVYGFQVEEGSYPTSYIKTSGSAVTRNADVCNNAQTTFNDSEGVLYAEIAYLRDRGKSSPFKVERISISDGTDFNRIFISNTTTANQIQVFVRNATGISFNQTVTISDITIFNKIALKYKANDFSLWINGSELATDTTYNYMPSGLDELKFEGASGAYDFEGKCKEVRVYNTALTDTELQELTTL